MPDRPIIFLGPSLSRGEAEQILDADYRPPLRAGDLDSVRTRSVIGVVDGVLEKTSRIPAVEVRRAMDRGIRFFGSASTGALLAIEIDAAGFVGMGEVFSFLKEYRGNREELVISLYAEHDNTILTVPLINAVLALAHVSQLKAHALAASLCQIPLENRMWDRIENHVGQMLGGTLKVHLSQERNKNPKANDARLLLRHLKNEGPRGQTLHSASTLGP